MEKQPEGRVYSQEEPASSLEVVQEFTQVFSVLLREMERGMWSPGERAEVVAGEEQARAAMALESWLGESQEFVAQSVVSGLAEPLTARLAQSHAAMHKGSR